MDKKKSVRERFLAARKLIEQGYRVDRACESVGLHQQSYYHHLRKARKAKGETI